MGHVTFVGLAACAAFVLLAVFLAFVVSVVAVSGIRGQNDSNLASGCFGSGAAMKIN